LIADGCRIGDGVTIENSVIGLRCIVEDNATIRNSIIMGADYYERDADVRAAQRSGRPALGIGSQAVIDGVIIDKNCRIGKGARIVNEADVDQADTDDGICKIRDGIPVIVKGSELAAGWSIAVPAHA
jgi:glucose-1-phosphate adenylyltransferase